MKKLVMTVVFMTAMASLGNQYIDLCPAVEDIDIVVVGSPNIYYYSATNSRGEFFMSGLYGGDENNGPAGALSVRNAQLNDTPHSVKTELVCEYSAYSIYRNPILKGLIDH